MPVTTNPAAPLPDISLVGSHDIALIQAIGAVPKILRILCDTTAMGYAAIGRVTATEWMACAVLDRIGFGLEVGGQVDINMTFCRDVRRTCEPIVIDEASADPRFKDSPIPRFYGFESYIAVPITLASGEVWGTICALDPRATAMRDTQALPTLEMFAELVAAQIDLQQRLDISNTALIDEKAAGDLREQFIAVLGHDLRNPVAALMSGLSVLERRDPDEKASRVLGHMRQTCHRMSGLIDDVLDFARGRLGSGISLERRRTTDLKADLQQVIQEIAAVHGAAKLSVHLDIRSSVSCDPRRIGQLLSNLVANAVTHGAADQPVEVVAASDGSMFRLSVANCGVAIPADRMATLFHPYARGKAKGRQEGLGLGLFISSEIARSHGGSLKVSSNPGRTEFVFEMPAT